MGKSHERASKSFEMTKGYEMFIHYQPNPCGRSVGDCAVRAVSAALGITWEEVFDILVQFARNMCDMPSSDQVWGAVLRSKGFYRMSIPLNCPDCYTVEKFCEDRPRGKYVLGLGGHVTTVVNGCLFDSWDSSNEIPICMWYMKGE